VLPLNVPSNLKYTASHEWVRVDGDTATVGITDHAQTELGDIVYVDLPAAGRVVSSGDSMGSVESVKTVSEVYAPLSGEVVETNPMLGAQAELINTDPYGKGYLLKLRVQNPAELDALQDAEAYSAAIS
jgi:glycine cleavage system H protein